jgi:UDP:flavonoid glycosyltransferase YjiC (YdhE family)
VPLLLTPICNDQFHQAWFLEKNQMGLVHDLETAPADAVWRALEALLDDDGPYRQNTLRVAADYAAHDGAERCADLIEALGAP